MNSNGLTKIDISLIASFDGVLRELKALEEQLPQSDLSRFIVFNTAYTIVTDAIKDAADNNYFDKPVFIEQFTICFASYYFQAVNDIASGSSGLPPAWAKMYGAAKTDSVPVFVVLLMGANAHINHDLPLALACYISKNADYSLRDARRVDKLLIKSGKQIIPTFNESNKLLNTMKRRFRVLYYRPVMYVVLFWRIIAWRSYVKIKRNNETKDSHNRRSLTIANRLLKLGNYLSRR